MSFDRTTPQNLRAGAGVFLTIIAAGVVVWFVLWLQGRGNSTYIVTFTPDQGVYGLKVGSAVRVGGLVRGHITDIKASLDDSDAVDGYRVEIALARQVALYRAARIQSVVAGVAGDASLEIVDTGRGRSMSGAVATSAEEPGRLRAGGEIASSEAAAFDGMVGPKSAVTLRALVDHFKDTREQFEYLSSDAPKRLQDLRAEWTSLMELARGDIETWRTQWADLSKTADHALQTLGSGKDAPPDAVIPALKDVQGQLSQIDLTADSRRLNMSSAALAKAIETLDTIKAQAFAVRNVLSDADTGLGFAAADFSIAGAELAAVKHEVILSPWRLFASPSQRQLTDSDRTEQARVFAQAATEFETSMSALRQTLERDGDLLARSPGLAALLQAQMAASTAKFDAAVAHFAELLLGPAPAQPTQPAPASPPAK